MIHRIIDTNVAIVANGDNTHASPECQLACIDALVEIRNKGIIYLDDLNLILDEYNKNLQHSGQPGLGDAFFTHVCNNIGNTEKCIQVEITPTEDSFVEFPNDTNLEKFDNDDRKFVAVSIAAGNRPTILNAVDARSWPVYIDQLQEHGVKVKTLCNI